MGRNGQKPPVFPRLVAFIRDNVGKTVTVTDILDGQIPSRDAATSYLYKFVKAGYLKMVEGESVMDPLATYKVLREFPRAYNSMNLKNELRIASGLLPREPKYRPV